jgi:hypothetical protein
MKENLTWILEQTRFANDHNVAQRLGYIVQEFGNEVITFKTAPTGANDFSFLDEIPSPAIYYGGMNSFFEIRATCKYIPHPFGWYNSKTFSCTTYYKTLKPFILQENHLFTTPQLLSEEREPIFDTLGQDACIFVRSNDNEKNVSGQLLKWEDVDIFLRTIKGYNQFPDDGEIVVAEPLVIKAEWRFVVVNDKVVNGSLYKQDNFIKSSPDFPMEALELAQKAIDHWSPAVICVIDIALVEDDYKVIEIGPFNYAGLYECDLYKIVSSINSYFFPC